MMSLYSCATFFQPAFYSLIYNTLSCCLRGIDYIDLSIDVHLTAGNRVLYCIYYIHVLKSLEGFFPAAVVYIYPLAITY